MQNRVSVKHNHETEAVILTVQERAGREGKLMSSRITGLKGLNEAAEILNISTFTLRRLIDSGEVRSVTIGARRLLSIDEIERLCKEGAGTPRTRKAEK
jgi:excisionase family DNA binding protein